MTDDNSNHYVKLSQTMRKLVWLSYAGLIAILVISSFPPFQTSGASIYVILGVKLVPLLLVLPGLYKDVIRSYAWTCFIVLFYFTQGVVKVYLLKGELLDVGITFFSVTLFLSAMFYIKWQKSLGRML